MGLFDVFSHVRTRDDEILKGRGGVWLWNARENPKEVFSKVLLGGFQANATCSIAREKCFYLDVGESGASLIAAQNVRIWRVA